MENLTIDFGDDAFYPIELSVSRPAANGGWWCISPPARAAARAPCCRLAGDRLLGLTAAAAHGLKNAQFRAT